MRLKQLLKDIRIFGLNIRNVSLLLILLVLFSGNANSLRSNPIYITQSESYHVVQKGDTLFNISRRYSLSVEQLKLFNNLDSEQIFVGQKIYLVPSVPAKSEYVTIRPIPEDGYHIVQRGETVYRISKMYDLEIMDILEYNNLETFDIIEQQKIWLIPGQVDPAVRPVTETVTEEITPSKPGEISYHVVKAGENLYRISLRYDMTLDQLRELNDLETDAINVGQRLKVIPGATAAHIPSTREERERESRTAPAGVTPKGDIYPPVNGRVVSEFGIRNGMPHNGIDIAAPLGEPIYAALGGKVVFVGTQRGYGNVIVLEHADYIMTVYAHNERNLVRLGEKVKRGQPIATVGQSGNASGPHLHFEYRVKGKAVNPRGILPDF
jgi:murein DD-endopeptidase MepM/ murein hydrolase activator NlpD